MKTKEDKRRQKKTNEDRRRQKKNNHQTAFDIMMA